MRLFEKRKKSHKQYSASLGSDTKKILLAKAQLDCASRRYRIQKNRSNDPRAGVSQRSFLFTQRRELACARPSRASILDSSQDVRASSSRMSPLYLNLDLFPREASESHRVAIECLYRYSERNSPSTSCSFVEDQFHRHVAFPRASTRELTQIYLIGNFAGERHK